MKRVPVLSILKLVGIILFASVIFSCNHKRRIIHINPAFSKYIEAFTSGVISKKNTIRLQLSADVNSVHTINQPLDEDLFDFSPRVSGKAYWVDNRTIEFKPEKRPQAQ